MKTLDDRISAHTSSYGHSPLTSKKKYTSPNASPFTSPLQNNKKIEENQAFNMSLDSSTSNISKKKYISPSSILLPSHSSSSKNLEQKQKTSSSTSSKTEECHTNSQEHNRKSKGNLTFRDRSILPDPRSSHIISTLKPITQKNNPAQHRIQNSSSSSSLVRFKKPNQEKGKIPLTSSTKGHEKEKKSSESKVIEAKETVVKSSCHHHSKSSYRVPLTSRDRPKSEKITKTSNSKPFHSHSSSKSISSKPILMDKNDKEGQGMTASYVLKHYMNKLTSYEQGYYPLYNVISLAELFEFDKFYYLGDGAHKVHGIPQSLNNNCYDDHKGYYKIVLKDHISYRYEIISLLGKGSFGQVLKVFDHKNQTYNAIKIIRNKARFNHQAKIETKVLYYCNEKAEALNYDANIIHIYDSFFFRSHYCISFELLSINLFDFLRNNHYKGFSMGLIRRFAVQLLVSLNFLSENKIIHCDLKPENILLRQPNKSSLRLIDFGSSCFENERIYTYIQSRFYRSPEIILGIEYTSSIDIWSLACILVELYTGYPLFPGENEVEQLACIMEIVGIPSPSFIDSCCRKKTFFHDNNTPKCLVNSRGKTRLPGSLSFAQASRSNNKYFLSFLQDIIIWEPEKRLTPAQALQHPWIIKDESN